MPFVSAVRFYPALGKPAEYRRIAEERTRAMQSAGLDAQLSTATRGPDYSYLLLSYRHETLADYGSSRAKVQVGFDEFNARQAPLARQSPVTFLNERLQATNPAGTVKWQQSNVLAPSVGKAADLRALLLEDGKRIEEMGRRFALLVQVAGPESGVFHANLQLRQPGCLRRGSRGPSRERRSGVRTEARRAIESSSREHYPRGTSPVPEPLNGATGGRTFTEDELASSPARTSGNRHGMRPEAK